MIWKFILSHNSSCCSTLHIHSKLNMYIHRNRFRSMSFSTFRHFHRICKEIRQKNWHLSLYPERDFTFCNQNDLRCFLHVFEIEWHRLLVRMRFRCRARLFVLVRLACVQIVGTHWNMNFSPLKSEWWRVIFLCELSLQVFF